MNIHHFALTPARRHIIADRPTARIAVTANLFVGASGFATCEARVTVYRDEADRISFELVEVEGWRGSAQTWTPLEPAPNGYSVNMDHHVYDFIIEECEKPAVVAQMEEALDAAEAEYEA